MAEDSRPAIMAVFYDGRLAATVAEPDGALELRYEPDLVENAAGQPLLSVRLPVGPEPFDDQVTRPFLEGFLPEGDIRRRLANRYRLADNDVFGLLAEIGRDCAGALSFMPTSGGEATEEEGSVGWLDEHGLQQLIEDLPVRPLGDDADEGIRLSLAGAQDKALVVMGTDGQLGLPKGSMPSTHILKPQSALRTRSGRPRLPGLVENEAFCMRLAARVGLNVANVRLRDVAGELVLVVTRYDRQKLDDGSIRRLHQEDACQALSILPHRKYEQHGGPGVADVVELLRTFSASAARDLLEFLERLTFNFVIGNLDAHGKNTSLLHTERGIVLAPAYDLVSTMAYPHLDRRLSMAIGGQFQADQVTARHWAQQLASLGLDTVALRRRLHAVAQRIVAVVPETRAEVAAEGADHEILDAIEDQVRRASRVVEDLTSWQGKLR